MIGLLKNGAFLTASRILEKGMTFLVIILASRRLGSASMDDYFAVLALVSLFLPAINLGLSKVLMQRWPARGNAGRKSLFTKLLGVKLILGGLTYLAVTAIGHALGVATFHQQVLTAAFLAIFFDDLAIYMRTPAMAKENAVPEAVLPLATRTLLLLCVWLGTEIIATGEALLWACAACNGIGACVSFLVSYKEFEPQRFKNRILFIGFVREGIPFSLTSVFVMLSLHIDSVILARYWLSDVSRYNLAYRAVQVFTVLSGGLCMALFPRISRYKKQGDLDGAAMEFSLILKIFIVVFGLGALGMALLGPPALEFFLGEDFYGCGHYLRLLALLIPLAALANLMGFTLEASGRQRFVLLNTCMMAAFNIITNFLLIPTFGASGAAATTIATELVGVTVMTVWLWKAGMIRMRSARATISGLPT